MKALITGFDPFGPYAFNPSGALLAALRADPPSGCFDVCAFQPLPTVFDASRALLIAAMERESPDVTIMFGLAAATPTIRLERIALNLDAAELPDNSGRRRDGEAIIPGALLARRTTFPVTALRDTLAPQGFDVIVSNHAGAYVCNHVYYAALHHIATTGSPCQALFVHLPEVTPDGIPHLTRFAAALFRALRRQAPVA